MSKLISTKNRAYISLVGSSETGKSLVNYNWLKIRMSPPKFDNFYCIYQRSQPIYIVMQKEIDNPQFVQSANVDIEDLLKSNGTKHL